jgi:RNA polymerase sigma factor (TIGR02999 family)
MVANVRFAGGADMNKVTEILGRIELGDPQAADELLPLVYDALRRLAAQRLAQERPGQTLQATALVHEAYVRLLDGDQVRRWESRGHFYSAAGEAMRRILVEQARRKGSLKRQGDRRRERLSESSLAAPQSSEEVLALSEALDKLAGEDSQAAELVKLRFFAGLSGREAAQALGIPARSADRLWAYARSYLFRELYPDADLPASRPS